MQDRCDIEQHFITTDDGYILQAHRVKLKENLKKDLKDKTYVDQPVLFAHSFMSSSAIMFVPNAKYFIEKGCDVWLANQRGNRWSMYHTNPNISEKEFFDYDIDDHTNDIKCFYEEIIKVTKKQKIMYFGYSMGGLLFATSHSKTETKEFFQKHTLKAILIAPFLYPSLAQKGQG